MFIVIIKLILSFLMWTLPAHLTPASREVNTSKLIIKNLVNAAHDEGAIIFVTSAYRDKVINDF